MDIQILLSQIRASRGDVIAQQGFDELKRTEVNLTLESLCASMQIEANRIQSGESQKLENQSIEAQNKILLKQSIDDLIYQYQAEEALMSQYFHQYSETRFLLMSPAAQILWIDIHQLSLDFNFDQIALMLKDFSFQDTNRILACLLIQTLHQRSVQRKAMHSVLC